MTLNTISNDVTLTGGKGTLLANRYRVVRQLGQGGMGSVWLAEDTQLDNKPFAIKMLPSILVSNKRAYNQLKSEALVAMRLAHPNIVQIRAFEENNGNPFLVMDYIDGQTLDDYLAEKGMLSEGETIKLLKPIALALDYAHGEGVVHRDVKPANVMIRKDGHPYILDFGIAREIQETMTRVTGKLSSGTLLYMSPEQLRGLPPKASQDIYSFAAMAYECLKGEPPFSRGQIEYQILNEKPVPLPDGARLSLSIMRGLSKDHESRPVSCTMVLFAASAATSSHRVKAKASATLRRISPPTVASPQVPRKRNITEIIIPIVFILSALMVFGGVMWYRDVQRRELAKERADAAQQAEAARRAEEEVEAARRKAQEEDLAKRKRDAEERKAKEDQERRLAEERRAKEEEMARESISAIKIEAKVHRGKVERISDEDGFKRKIEEACDLFAKAEALYDEKKWHDAAIAFTNHVVKCKELIALDVQRQEALQSRKSAQAAFREAESNGAKTYDADNWDEAVRMWQNASKELDRNEFASAAALFDDAARKFADSGREAQANKRKADEKIAEERKIAEAKQAEEQRRKEVDQAAENKRRQEARRKTMQSLPGKWRCRTKTVRSDTQPYETDHELIFRNNGTWIKKETIQGCCNTFTGSWSLSGNVLTLQYDNRATSYSESLGSNNFDASNYHSGKYIVYWRDDGSFELRHDIEDYLRFAKSKFSGVTIIDLKYDANGTYVLHSKWSKLFFSGEMKWTETAKIFKRVAN